MTILINADAEQARQTGGMIALWPDVESVSRLAVPGGEPDAELHLTLAYFGEDVSDLEPLGALNVLDSIADGMPKIQARAFAHATFNPDAANGRTPCAVYLIGDSQEIAVLHAELTLGIGTYYGDTGQHSPFHAHVTAGYGLEAGDLTYTGPVTFDRLSLSWMGETYDRHLV